jgi:hypothetical protein
MYGDFASISLEQFAERRPRDFVLWQKAALVHFSFYGPDPGLSSGLGSEGSCLWAVALSADLGLPAARLSFPVRRHLIVSMSETSVAIA